MGQRKKTYRTRECERKEECPRGQRGYERNEFNIVNYGGRDWQSLWWGNKTVRACGCQRHIIMDYSIYDAMEAEFNKIVFVIRKDLLADFDEVIGQRMKNKGIQIEYAFQEIEDVPEKYKEKTINRTKPWGTGQAILAAKDKIHEPFVVINADDYYGKEGFVKLAEYLKNGGNCCMAGFVLKNTLSDNGTVTRGICVEEDGWLKEVVETKGISKNTELDMESLVSMNMWGLRPEFMDLLEKGFVEFFENGGQGEFLIPTYIGELLEKKAIDVKVLKSNDTWYGMTYKEDGPAVRENIERLVKEGLYPEEF